ncbi:S41 family peptidase [Chitinophaga sp. 22620]|uniref:S41 family peptidase n=1 Tax=Chitinophaga sp. 22620 TaxID=3453952 RepID=UPI003F855710
MKPVILFFCLLISSACFAQRLDPKELQEAVSGIAKLIEDNYVYPAKGKQISNYLLGEYKKGTFAKCSSWKMFDSLATQHLKTFSHDGHLYVRDDPETAGNLLNKKPDTTEAFSYDLFYYGQKAIDNNFGFREVKVLDGNTGYIKISEINISSKSLPVLFAAMRFVANTKALIIDLRGNGGGGSDVGAVFESFFLAKNVPLLEFKSRHGESTLEKTVAWLTEPKYERPLYILIDGGTASAAEALAYALQMHKRAVIVGQPSAGGAHMNTWYPVNEHLYVSVSTAAPAKPGTEESWEQKGVQPDHRAEKGKEIATLLGLLK